MILNVNPETEGGPAIRTIAVPVSMTQHGRLLLSYPGL